MINARATAWVRVAAASLHIALPKCFVTVRSLMRRMTAISHAVLPRAAQVKHSCSRSDSRPVVEGDCVTDTTSQFCDSAVPAAIWRQFGKIARRKIREGLVRLLVLLIRDRSKRNLLSLAM